MTVLEIEAVTADTVVIKRGSARSWFYVTRKNQAGWKLVCAPDAETAIRRTRGATGARLALPSSYWQEQRRLGLYPPITSRSKRKR